MRTARDKRAGLASKALQRVQNMSVASEGIGGALRRGPDVPARSAIPKEQGRKNW
jgi:hypothetical protein